MATPSRLRRSARLKPAVASLRAALVVLVALVGLSPVGAESVGGLVLAANRLTERANAVREQLEAGTLGPEAAIRPLGELLIDCDAIDRRALDLCRRACSEQTCGEAADILLNGSIVQSLYVLTLATATRFPPERGYAAVHDILVTCPELYCRRTLADPRPLLDRLADPSDLPEPGEPWMKGTALRVERELRESLPAWASDTGSLADQMARHAEFLRAVMEEYERTRDVELIAVHLMGKLHMLAGYCQGLRVLTGEHAWAGLAQGFEALAQRATCDPEELVNVYTLEITRDDTGLIIPALR